MTKILLVEDNEMNRDMLARRLVRRGFEVSIAVDGAESIGMVQRESPDLILMDMSLPVMDGYQATRILKENPETRTIPVLGLSAHAMTGDAQRALDAGCDDYDTKPVDMKRLLGKIEMLLESTAPVERDAAGRGHGAGEAAGAATPIVPPPPPPAEATTKPPPPPLPETPAATVLLPPLPLPAARPSPPEPAHDRPTDQGAAERETFSTVPLEPPANADEPDVHPTVNLPPDWEQRGVPLGDDRRPADPGGSGWSPRRTDEQSDRERHGRGERHDGHEGDNEA